MKSNAKIILQSIACLLACTILCSLVFSILYFFHIINSDFFHILNWMFGCVAYCIAGFILGFRINKKALLHAFVIVSVLGIIATFLLESFSFMMILKLGSKLFCYLLGCAFAISKKA